MEVTTSRELKGFRDSSPSLRRRENVKRGGFRGESGFSKKKGRSQQNPVKKLFALGRKGLGNARSHEPTEGGPPKRKRLFRAETGKKTIFRSVLNSRGSPRGRRLRKRKKKMAVQSCWKSAEKHARLDPVGGRGRGVKQK